MADNTVTMILNGDVPLEEFSKAISNFADLIKALSAESGAPLLDWLVSDLSVSSAMATASAPSGDEKQIQSIIDGFADVGTSLENRTEIRHSEPVKVAARKIISIEDKRIKSVHFDTAKRAAIISPLRMEAELPSVERVPTPHLQVLRPAVAAYGAINGRIQTLTNRGNLRFTLYDLHYDKAVSCYFAEGKQEAILGLWGKLAIVEGFITRDPLTGRPLSIRQVETITPLPESSSNFDYQQARGISPSLTRLSPEEAIEGYAMLSDLRLIYWDACVPLAYINGEPTRLPHLEGLLQQSGKDFQIITSVYSVRAAIPKGWALKPGDAIHLATADHLKVSEFQTYDDKLDKFTEITATHFAICRPIANQPVMVLDQPTTVPPKPEEKSEEKSELPKATAQVATPIQGSSSGHPEGEAGTEKTATKEKVEPGHREVDLDSE